jgi:hypothetical protein
MTQPLAERLGDLLGQGGFELTERLGTAAGDVGGIALPAAALDLADLSGGLTGVLDDLAEHDTAGLVGAVTAGVTAAGSALARMPAVDDLLGPLTAVLAPVELLLDPGTSGLMDRLAAAGDATAPATGLSALSGGLASLGETIAGPDVAATVDAISALVPGLQPQAVLDLLRGPAPGLAALVRLVGALMAVESAVRELHALGTGVGGLLDDERIDALRQRIAALGAGTGLVAAVGTADPDDAVEAGRLALPVRELRVTIEETAELLRTGLGFGEAALVAVDVPALVERLRLATAAVAEHEVPAVAELARTVLGWLQPVLAVEIPLSAPSLDALWDQVAEAVGQLSSALATLDPVALLDPLTAQLRDGLALLGELEQRARGVVAAVQAALDTIVEAAAALDVSAVTDAVRLVLDPVAGAIRSVEEAVGAAETAVATVATTVTGRMLEAETHLGGAAADVTAAFERVRAAVALLDLAELGDQLRAGLQPIVTSLQSAELGPYFDAGVDVMHTTAEILANVPIDLLPDDVEQDLRDAAAPVKAIDFDAQVVQPLQTQLADIRAGVDVEVLAAVKTAQQEVVTFLEDNDPEQPLLAFEAQTFDPFIAEVRALDPAAALEPVHELLDGAAEALGALDLRALVAPADAAFDTVLHTLGELDPAVLLAPAVQEVADTVEALRTALALDTWRARLDQADAAVERLAGRLDPAPVVALLAGLWDELVAAVRTPGEHESGALGVLVSGLLQSSGLVVRAEALDTVRGWIGGVDAAEDVRGRIAAAAGSLDAAVQTVTALDPVPLLASLGTAYDAVTASVADLPEDSVLRRVLSAELAGADPREVVGPLVANRERYLVTLLEVAALVAGLTGEGRSELAAVAQGLREALRPLAVAPQRLRNLLASLGIEVGTSLRDALADLLAGSPPQRALEPLVPVVVGLREVLVQAVREGLIAPLRTALDDVEGVLDALDISFVTDELGEVFTAVQTQLEALRPSTLLGPVLTELDDLIATIQNLDPLTAVEPLLEQMRTAVTRVADLFRPSVLARPALDAYDEVVAAVAAVDVADVLEPVLAALDAIGQQLQDGLDRAGAALQELQEALP